MDSRNLNKLSIDAGDYASEIINRLAEEFVQNILPKYFVLTSLKLLKGKRREKKPPYIIDTSIDAVNNWLLESAHFVLDYHKGELEHNLMRPNILTPKEYLRGGAIHPFQTISL